MMNLWAKPKLNIVETAEAGFRGCFVIKAIERENIVL